jgi:CRISPR-associated exonuclease Cas4
MPRRRTDVAFDAVLRRQTEDTARRLHELMESRQTPPAVYSKRCENCSLLHLCLPEITGGKKSVARYIEQMLADEKIA